MGIGGAAANMLIDKGYKEEEFKMTRDMVSEIKRINIIDKNNSKIVSDGK